MESRNPVRDGAAAAEYWFEEGCFISEWSNADDDPDCSIARARVPAGGQTRWHRLEAITERYVVLTGSGRVEVGDRPSAAIGPASVVTIAPGERQRVRADPDSELIFLAICTPRFRADAYIDDERD